MVTCHVHSVVGTLVVPWLTRCPICRRKFQYNVCHCSFPKSPLFIPGIGESLSLPEVRRQTIDKENESYRSLCQASTIPAADNLPDLALPGPDETSLKERILGNIYLFL